MRVGGAELLFLQKKKKPRCLQISQGRRIVIVVDCVSRELRNARESWQSLLIDLKKRWNRHPSRCFVTRDKGRESQSSAVHTLKDSKTDGRMYSTVIKRSFFAWIATHFRKRRGVWRILSEAHAKTQLLVITTIRDASQDLDIGFSVVDQRCDQFFGTVA